MSGSARRQSISKLLLELRPNKWLKRTPPSVTSLAGASAAPPRPAAQPHRSAEEMRGHDDWR